MAVALSHSQLNGAKVVDHLDSPSAISQECLSVLKEVCGSKMVLLAPYRCPDQHHDTVDRLRVYHLMPQQGKAHVTAVKVRVHAITLTIHLHQRKLQSLICKEAVTLKHLKHPNIVPIIGFDLDRRLWSFAVDRAPDEVDLMRYIQENPSANLIALVCIRFVVIILRSVLSPAFGRCKGAPLPPFP